MIKLEIVCEDADEARLILNAQQYHNLIYDFTNQIRSARKHDGDVDKVIDTFIESFYTALDHHQGPY